METIPIEKAAALKAHENADKKGKKLLENLLGPKVFIIDIIDRIQCINDIFELNNTTQKEFDEETKNYKPRHKAQYFEELIVAAYNNNDGKLPDFKDGQWKGYPRFEMGSPSGVGFAYFDCVRWRTTSSVGARLVFYGPEYLENIRDAVKKFPEQFKQSRTT